MEVKLLTCTPNPEMIVASAAKLCYSKSEASEIMDGLTHDVVDKFVDMLVSMGHESPLEHVSFTFSIDGISRSCSHQLVRHRLASFSQKSQRYVNEDSFKHIIPDAVINNIDAKYHFKKAMYEAQEAYDKIVEILIESGLDDKEAYENARSVLPNACSTSLVMTMNARELLHFFEKRCCNRAQTEIRNLAEAMLSICKEQAPILFKCAGKPCLNGSCPEGNMSCQNK